jgi:hypothetical protein
MLPLDVMRYAMGLELKGGQWRSAASIAEKAAPYVHPKMAPRAEEGATTNSRSRSSEACRSSTPRLPNCRQSRLVASVHLLFVSPAVGSSAVIWLPDLDRPGGMQYGAGVTQSTPVAESRVSATSQSDELGHDHQAL